MKVANRIKKSTDFQKIIQEGKSLKSQSFSIFYMAGELSNVRIGISVSKRIGNAVKRNKVKRQIRAIIAKFVDLNKSFDVVIIVKTQYRTDCFANIQSELVASLGKVGIVK